MDFSNLTPEQMAQFAALNDASGSAGSTVTPDQAAQFAALQRASGMRYAAPLANRPTIDGVPVPAAPPAPAAPMDPAGAMSLRIGDAQELPTAGAGTLDIGAPKDVSRIPSGPPDAAPAVANAGGPGSGPAGMAAKMSEGAGLSPGPAPAAPRPAPRPSGDDDLAAVQADANRKALLAHTIGQLVQGGSTGLGLRFDPSSYEEAAKMARQPVADLLQRREQLRQQVADKRTSDLEDPNSEISKRSQMLALAKGLISPEQAKSMTAGMFGDLLKGASFDEAKREHDLMAKRYGDALTEDTRHHKAEEQIGWAKANKDGSEARAAKEQDKVEKDAGALAKQEGPYAELARPGGALDTLQEAVKKSDIPGVGFFDNLRVIPDAFRSEEGINTRQAMQKAFVTIADQKRWSADKAAQMRKEYGLEGNSEAALRLGVKKLVPDVLAAMKEAEAGHRPEAVKRVKERGGITASDVEHKPPGPPQALKAHPQDAKAIAWAKARAGDPDAAAILAANGE